MRQKIQRRLEQLETRRGLSKGCRHFGTVDGVNFYETTTPGAFDYRSGLIGADGNPPPRPYFTQADLNGFERAGWDISSIHWKAMESVTG